MNVFFRRTTDGFEWLKTSDEAITAEYFSGTLDDMATFYADNPTLNQWVMVTSALSTIYRKFTFTAKEKKHIEQAVPFMLEEEVISDIDDLHVVTHKTDNLELGVVAVEKDQMAAAVKALRNKGIDPSYCVSTYHFLPLSTADWLIVYRDNEFVVRCGDELFAIDGDGLAVFIETMTENYSELPDSIDLATFSIKEEAQAVAFMPEVIKPLLNCRQEEYGKLLQENLKGAKKWNLLTGRYASSEGLVEKLKPWVWVILGLAVVYLIDLGLTAMQSQAYQNQYQTVKKQTNALFRQVVPRGVIVDPKRQLDRLVKNAAEKTNTGFSNLLSTVVPILKSPSIDINSMNFDKNKSEFRVDMVVNDFAMLENIMDQLKKSKLKPEIQNSSQQDDKLRVRLRIGS